jgi:hypothetical protein
MTGNVTFTFTGANSSVACGFTLYLSQDGTGGRNASWPGSVVWIGGLAPSLPSAPGSLSVLVFQTVNGGTTWYGSAVQELPALPLSIANGGTGQGTAAAALAALGGIPLTGATMQGWFAPAVVPLSFGTALSVDASAGNVFAVTLTASTGTFVTPANPVDGQVIRLRLIQDGTGGRTVSWGTAFTWGSTGGTAATAPSLSAGTARTDFLGFEYDAALGKWAWLSAPFPQGFR